MHMANNRLLVFARKPAPVQVTYLAYCGTTGLEHDGLSPDRSISGSAGPGRAVLLRAVGLPAGDVLVLSADGRDAAGQCPARLGGRTCHASARLNNFCKVTAPTLAAWSRLLQAVPGSRLLLHAHAGSHRDRVRGFLAEQGISPERVAFVDYLAHGGILSDVYQRIDVALDPFPYGGGTTTCDALWMGVPVVSLAGQTAVGRGGLSISVEHGADRIGGARSRAIRADRRRVGQRSAAGLGKLRATLRDRMRSSPLMDAPRFARNIEAAYRKMWRRCRSASAEPVR